MDDIVTKTHPWCEQSQVSCELLLNSRVVKVDVHEFYVRSYHSWMLGQYRVKSYQATQFRIWAKQRVKNAAVSI